MPYGSSRIGIYKGNGLAGKRILGFKEYEISNHLGNVLSTVSDLRFTTALILSQTDYRPFGQVLKERTWQNQVFCPCLCPYKQYFRVVCEDTNNCVRRTQSPNPKNKRTIGKRFV